MYQFLCSDHFISICLYSLIPVLSVPALFSVGEKKKEIHKVPSCLMICTIPIIMTAGSIHVNLLTALLSLVNWLPVPAQFLESDVTWAHQTLCIPMNRKQTSNKHPTGFVWLSIAFDSLIYLSLGFVHLSIVSQCWWFPRFHPHYWRPGQKVTRWVALEVAIQDYLKSLMSWWVSLWCKKNKINKIKQHNISKIKKIWKGGWFGRDNELGFRFQAIFYSCFHNYSLLFSGLVCPPWGDWSALYIYIYISIIYIYIYYIDIYISITYFPLSSEVLLGLINERTRNKKAGENRGKVLLPESGTTVLAGSAFLSHGHSISQNICPS